MAKLMASKKLDIYINIVSTFVAQGAALLLPVILAPSISRLVGAEPASVFVLSITISQFLLVLTDYGFGLSAVKRLAIIKVPSLKCSILVSKIYTIKLMLILISAIPLYFYVESSKNLNVYKALFFWIFAAASIMAYQSIWYFQATQKQAEFNFYLFFTRLAFVLIAPLIISEANDLWRIGLLYFAVNVIFVILMNKKMDYVYILPKFKSLIIEIKKSFSFFFSRMSAAFYTISGGVFLSIAASSEELGRFVFSEIIYRIGVAAVYPITQVLYPYFAKNKEIKKYNKGLWFVIIFALIFTLALVFGARELEILMINNGVEGSVLLVKIFSIAVGFSICSVFLGYPFFVIVNRIELANTSVNCAALLQLLLFSVIWSLGIVTAVNVALCILLNEAFVFAFRFYFYMKLKK
ncbi:oligosaccharide flippase family protein [Limnohabitans sp. WS1]|uniref:oligosaccharide flippase family protein n=1 Tax=Limnohabitans sp. WS1 TaxID=1100726 RepID=UPI001304CFF9|nr:oligosaccharide flippase family protein [Limnohabitans sp. WS1]